MRPLVAVVLVGWVGLAAAAPPGKPTIVSIAPKDGVKVDPANDPATRAKAELEILYDQMGAAVEKGDVQAFLRLRAPEYTESTADGRTLDARGAAAAASAWFDALKRPAKADYGIARLDLQQEAATADVGRLVTTRETVGGKTVEIELVTRRLETWLKGPDGWRLRHSGVEAVVQRTVDGSVVSEE